MPQETNFEAIKAEILNRAKAAHACIEQYGRAYKSETLYEPCNVIKDNFHWCSNNKVITSDLLMQYREDFAQNDIFINISIRSGFLLCDNATVEAWGQCHSESMGQCHSESMGQCHSRSMGQCHSESMGQCLLYFTLYYRMQII